MTWHATSARTRMWLQLRIRPLNATEAKAAMPGVKAKAVDTALYQLKAEGFAELLPDGKYKVTDQVPPLPDDCEWPAEQAAALNLVQDCPAGIDQSVLSIELKVSPRRVDALLAEPIAQKRVRRVELRGGLVRYQPVEAAA